MTPEILIVETEESLRRFIARVLSHAGYHVHTAVSHVEAMDICRKLQIDLVLSDVGWQTTAAHDLARWIAVERPATRVLLMAAWESDCERCPYTSGCSVLQKPFEASVLRAKVAESLSAPLP